MYVNEWNEGVNAVVEGNEVGRKRSRNKDNG